MENKNECPICGCKDIGEGEFSGYSVLRPRNKTFSTGSVVIVDVCTNCGHIISMRVEKPKKFKLRK